MHIEINSQKASSEPVLIAKWKFTFGSSPPARLVEIGLNKKTKEGVKCAKKRWKGKAQTDAEKKNYKLSELSEILNSSTKVSCHYSLCSKFSLVILNEIRKAFEYFWYKTYSKKKYNWMMAWVSCLRE